MAADKELLKEVALELWNTTKKLRPGLPKAPRAQLVLKALLTIGDMSDQLEAAMVLGVIEAQEPDDEPVQEASAGEDKTVSESKTERGETPRVVRKRSSSRGSDGNETEAPQLDEGGGPEDVCETKRTPYADKPRTHREPEQVMACSFVENLLPCFFHCWRSCCWRGRVC